MLYTLLCCLYCQPQTDLIPLSSTFITNFEQVNTHWPYVRLNNFLNFDETKVLITGYFYSNFNYCPLARMAKSVKSLNYVESLQKILLGFL